MKSSALLLLPLLLLPAEATAARRLAIVVGHDFGVSGEAPLRFARADAERVRDVLVELGQFERDRVELLLGPSAADLDGALARTRARIREAAQSGEQTILLFYFSGHGERTAIHLGASSVATERLETALREAGATTTIAILDACQNDRAPRAKQKGIEPAPAFAWSEARESLPAGFVLLTSAASGEVAQESDDLEGSLFTHHLVAGLRGAADFDRDGAVTLAEVYHFGYTRTLRDTHANTTSVQHSELDVRLAGQGSLVLTQPAKATATLRLARDVNGYLLIVHDATARILAEIHRAEGTPAEIAVPAGLYRVQLRNEDEVRTGLVRVERGVTVLARDDLTPATPQRALGKGGSFDPHPWYVGAGVLFGRSAVEGFGVVPMIGLAGGWRIDPSFRLGLRFSLGGTGAENEVWRYRQVETFLSASTDYALLTDPFVLTAGLRIGAAIVSQTGERDATDLTAALMTELETSELAVGPDGAITLGLEWPLSELFALRFDLETGGTLLRIDDRLDPRWRVAGGAMGILRL